MIMEAAKSPSLLSASWGPRRAGGIWVQFGPKARGPGAQSSEGRTGTSQPEQREQARVPCRARSSRAFGGADGAAVPVPSVDPTSSSSRSILTDRWRDYGLPALWASLSPVKLTHKINYHVWYQDNKIYEVRNAFRCLPWVHGSSLRSLHGSRGLYAHFIEIHREVILFSGGFFFSHPILLYAKNFTSVVYFQYMWFSHSSSSSFCSRRLITYDV